MQWRTTPALSGKGWVLAMLGRERPARGCGPALQAARPCQPASGADARVRRFEKNGTQTLIQTATRNVRDQH